MCLCASVHAASSADTGRPRKHVHSITSQSSGANTHAAGSSANVMSRSLPPREFVFIGHAPKFTINFVLPKFTKLIQISAHCTHATVTVAAPQFSAAPPTSFYSTTCPALRGPSSRSTCKTAAYGRRSTFWTCWAPRTLGRASKRCTYSAGKQKGTCALLQIFTDVEGVD